MENYQSLRVLVYGAGAIGGYFGGKLALAGINVDFIARGERLQAYKKNGIILQEHDGIKKNIKINALDIPHEKYDFILITAKSKETENIAQKSKPYLKSDGIIVSMQNGADNFDKLISKYPYKNVASGVVYSSITVPEPGVIYYRPTPRVSIGTLRKEDFLKHASDQDYSNLVNKINILVDIFKKSNVIADYSSNVIEIIWKKMLWNTAFNSLSAIFKSECGALIRNESSFRIMKKIMLEVTEVAKTKGVTLTSEDIDNALKNSPMIENYKTSALQDVLGNKTPEISDIMGPVVSSSSLTPVSDTISDICNYMFNGWFHVFPRLAADVIIKNKYNQILLINRKFEPFGWAIPGGFVNYGESVENAAARELKEETGIIVEAEKLKLLGVFSEPLRDPRGHTTSIIYTIDTTQDAVAGDDAKEAKFFDINELPDMAFDHKNIIEKYLQKEGLK